MQAKLIGKNAIDSMVNLIDDFAYGNDDVPEMLVDKCSTLSNAMKMIALCDNDDENTNEVEFHLDQHNLETLGSVYGISNDEEAEDTTD